MFNIFYYITLVSVIHLLLGLVFSGDCQQQERYRQSPDLSPAAVFELKHAVVNQSGLRIPMESQWKQIMS